MTNSIKFTILKCLAPQTCRACGTITPRCTEPHAVSRHSSFSPTPLQAAVHFLSVSVDSPALPALAVICAESKVIFCVCFLSFCGIWTEFLGGIAHIGNSFLYMAK